LPTRIINYELTLLKGERVALVPARKICPEALGVSLDKLVGSQK